MENKEYDIQPIHFKAQIIHEKAILRQAEA